MMIIDKVVTTLEDGSEVFDVAIIRGFEGIVIPAVTERDADQLRLMLRTLITNHTNEEITS